MRELGPHGRIHRLPDQRWELEVVTGDPTRPLREIRETYPTWQLTWARATEWAGVLL